MIKVLLIATACFVSAPSFSQIDTVLNRYKRFLLQRTVPEKEASTWMHTLTANGQFPDVNYTDTVKAKWKTSIHLEHIRDLAILYNSPSSKYYHQAAVAGVIKTALDHWLQQRYTNSNWWHNQIGVPQHMRDIIILFRDSLTQEQCKQAMEVLGQYRISGTGANLSWSADLGFHYGALSGDTALMQRCMNLMVKEIKVSTQEGVQPDYSFHQHGKRLQIYAYGEAFLKDNVRMAWQVRGTPWAFPSEKTGILINFVLEGWQWMARGINTVPGTIDRSVSRPGDLQNADIRGILPLLQQLDPSKAASFAAISKQQHGKGPWLQGYRFFPYSDFTAYHHQDFSFFLKTISIRTLPAEAINSENLKGRFMNSGDAYIVQNGREYFNLMPVWNWDNLPGITNVAGAEKIIRQPFSGGVTDGKYGFTVMDYALGGKHNDTVLSARKFWACYENKVVCLIAGLHSGGVPYTVLDQCRQQGKILSGTNWVAHHNTAYILLQPASIDLRSGNATGSWQSINLSQSPAPVTEQVFMPVWKHEGAPAGGYIIAHVKNKKAIKTLVKEPGCTILSNTNTCQAVRFANGTTMLSFWKPGSITISENKTIVVDQPCLLMMAGNTLYASDPSQTGTGVTVNIGDMNYAMALPADGTTIKIRL